VKVSAFQKLSSSSGLQGRDGGMPSLNWSKQAFEVDSHQREYATFITHKCPCSKRA